VRQILAILAIVLTAAAAQARDVEITMVSDPGLEATGLWSYVLPRFKLKTGIRVVVVYGNTEAGGDVLLLRDFTRPVMANGEGTGFGATLARTSPHAAKLFEWLTSVIGQRTIAAYRVDGQQMFFPITQEIAKEIAPLVGNIQIGEKTALAKCGRCHVISEKNKFGGIGSTPSFGALRALEDWRERFGKFWTLNPHPSFTQIEGVTKPFNPERPPIIYPIFLTMDEVGDIGAYLQTIKPKELGQPLVRN
jgi:mono/diheme cytochrome c family protein